MWTKTNEEDKGHKRIIYDNFNFSWQIDRGYFVLELMYLKA